MKKGKNGVGTSLGAVYSGRLYHHGMTPISRMKGEGERTRVPMQRIRFEELIRFFVRDGVRIPALVPRG